MSEPVADDDRERDEAPVVSYATRRPLAPAPSLFVSCLIGAGVVLILLCFLMPSISSGPRISPRATCASNLRGIGQELKLYANNHGDAFPPNLATLLNSSPQ